MDTLAHRLAPAAQGRLHSVNGAMCKWKHYWREGGAEELRARNYWGKGGQ